MYTYPVWNIILPGGNHIKNVLSLKYTTYDAIIFRTITTRQNDASYCGYVYTLIVYYVSSLNYVIFDAFICGTISTRQDDASHWVYIHHRSISCIIIQVCNIWWLCMWYRLILHAINGWINSSFFLVIHENRN